MTMHASIDSGVTSGTNVSQESLHDANSATGDVSNLADEERGLGRASGFVPFVPRSRPSSSTPPPEGETELQTRPNSISSTGKYLKRKTSQLLEAVRSSGLTNKPTPPKLAALVEAYATSEIAAAIKAEGEQLRRELERSGAGAGADGQEPSGGVVVNELPDVALETTLLRGRKRASWGTQFRILSGRAFKNLYRDPALLTAHYLSSIALACESSFVADRSCVC